MSSNDTHGSDPWFNKLAAEYNKDHVLTEYRLIKKLRILTKEQQLERVYAKIRFWYQVANQLERFKVLFEKLAELTLNLDKFPGRKKKQKKQYFCRVCGRGYYHKNKLIREGLCVYCDKGWKSDYEFFAK